jgi:hypothetical protein
MVKDDTAKQLRYSQIIILSVRLKETRRMEDFVIALVMALTMVGPSMIVIGLLLVPVVLLFVIL